jgi:WD40 repeat protein
MRTERVTDPLVGRTLGEFVLRERIGQGGFGAVYRAIQPALDREAVIKVLHSRLNALPMMTERFLREAKLASKLDHPYAAHIYAFGAEPDGELWIAMELVRGTPLDRLLEVQGRIPLERFVPLLDRICEVVHTAHEQGIVHRDIKPANVMVLSRAGRMLPKLLDLGIAKGGAEPQPDVPSTGVGFEATALHSDSGVELANTIDTGESSGLTQRGAIIGSPHYMAPEQWVDAGKVDGRTDIYALAILAYEALTGKPPFTGNTTTELASAHAGKAPPPLGAGLPAALDRVLAKALAKQPGERYPDALAFAAAFRDASGLGAEAPTLPALDAGARTRAMNSGPQPIAEAVAAVEAARNAHQAREAVLQLTRTVVRYIGLLAIACRSRVGAGMDPPGAAEILRALYRRSLSDREWLELARLLTHTWLDRRDAYPIPELVGLFHDQRPVREDLEALVTLREREVPAGDALLAMLEGAVARLSRVLEALAFLDDYALVTAISGGLAESWMGVRRAQRATTALRGTGLKLGALGLVDKEGVPVLSLAPLVQVAVPTPGSPLELFLFEGRDQRGARLVALPSAFEHHDDELWGWFRLQLAESLDDASAAVAEGKAPYRGLSAFSAEDGAMFFGREKLVDAFLNRLRVIPLLAVVGRSGAGKSSFVHAGVLPALPDEWRVITMRPGPSPLATLSARLEQAGIRVDLQHERDRLGEVLRADAVRNGPLVLVVDQLEEMFTLCASEHERRAFAEAIATPARAAEDPLRVIFTLRDDFLVRTEQLVALRNRIAQGLQLLTVPATEDLLRIVIEPARRAGFEFEDPELPQEIVREVADQPGALALISFTAEKLWQLRDRHFHQLTRAAYKSLGGVGGALARHAELTLQEMLPEEQALTREAFRHLVTTQGTRTVLARSELRQLLGGGEHADRVMEKLVLARLLVASENEAGAETIELVHEALLVAWPRLAEWRREDAEGTRFREQLRSAAQQWHERHRDEGLLWRGDALADFVRWRARNAASLTDTEAAFAAASEADAARGRRNRRILLAGAFASLLAVVVGLVLFSARIAGQRAQLRENLQRQYENQGRTLVLQGDPLRALAYLAKAGDLGAGGAAHDLLIAQAIEATDGELFEVHHQARVHGARFSHDGQKLVTASLDRTAIVWDANGRSLLTLHHEGDVSSAEFSPDDAMVLTASGDGTAIEWNATTGQILHRFVHSAGVTCAIYSHDGATVLTAGEDDVVVVWDAARGIERFRVRGAGAGMSACAFSPDDAVIAVADHRGTTRLWDAHGGNLLRELHGGPDDVPTVRFALGGSRLVTASSSRDVVEWDVTSGQQMYVLTLQGPVNSLEVSPDGRTILTAADNDHAAVVWDAASGTRLSVLSGHTASVRGATYSHDGRYIVTFSDDATVQLFDAASSQRLARWLGHRDAVIGASFDASGKRVVTSGADERAIVWRVQPQQRVLWLAGHPTELHTCGFSPDGVLAVSGGGDGEARVWDTTAGRLLYSVRAVEAGSEASGRKLWVNDAQFSPDSRILATAGGDGKIKLWDALTGAPRSTWTAGAAGATRISWSPDGSRLAAGDLDGHIRCWDVASGQLVFENRGHGGHPVYSVQFSPSGNELITTGTDLVVRLWSRDGKLLMEHDHVEQPFFASYDRTGTRVLSVGRQSASIWNPLTALREVQLVGHTGFVLTGSWSRDDTMVLTAAADGTARLWDAERGDQLAVYQHRGNVRFASFAANANRVIIGDDDGSVAIHDVGGQHLDDAALDQLLRCRVPFVVEGDRLLPREPDRSACEHY